jgi:hypothetical protein
MAACRGRVLVRGGWGGWCMMVCCFCSMFLGTAGMPQVWGNMKLARRRLYARQDAS